MGFVSDRAGYQPSVKVSPRDNARRSRLAWRTTFGGTAKEDSARVDAYATATPRSGNSGRSLATEPIAYKRLLQAFRSQAPGGWSDDRWEQSRHYTGIQYVGIHRTGEQLLQSEFKVYKRDPRHPEGKRLVTPDDPPEGGRMQKPYDLVKLLENPNDEDSFGDLMYNWNLQMDLTGSAYTWMVPNEFKTPMELYPVPTAMLIPQPVINDAFPRGYYRVQPLYPYGPFSSYPTPSTAVGTAIPSEWVMRMKYPHPLLRYDGYSPLTALREHIDELESINKSRFNSMRRTINPSAVLNFENMDGAEPLPEPEIERIRADIENSHMSPENAGQLFVATPGAKLEPWGGRPVDMDYQSGWDQLSSFILGAYGITKPAAGMIEDSSYSTLFATLKQLYWTTLNPKCHRFGTRITRVLAPYFGDDLIVEVSCKRIDDHEVTLQELDKLIVGGAITKNELRRHMPTVKLPPTDEPWGDEIAGEMPEQAQSGLGPAGMEVLGGEGGLNPDGTPRDGTSPDELREEPAVSIEGMPRVGDMGRGSMGKRLRPSPMRHYLNGSTKGVPCFKRSS